MQIPDRLYVRATPVIIIGAVEVAREVAVPVGAVEVAVPALDGPALWRLLAREEACEQSDQGEESAEEPQSREEGEVAVPAVIDLTEELPQSREEACEESEQGSGRKRKRNSAAEE